MEQKEEVGGGGQEKSSLVQMWYRDVTSPGIVAVDLGDFLHDEKYPSIVETNTGLPLLCTSPLMTKASI